MSRDFDAEFERLMGDLGDMDSKHPEQPQKAEGDQRPPREGGARDDEGDKRVGERGTVPPVAYEEIPEDLEVEHVRPMEDGQRRVGLVLTEIASARVLGHLMEAEGVKARALGTPTGALAWVNVTSEEDETAELLGSERSVAPEVAAVARAITNALGRPVVALQSWLSMEDEEEAAVVGQIVAWRFSRDHEPQSLSSGLVVAYMDPSVEDLLVGRTDILNHPNFDPPRSAWSALKRRGSSWFNRGKNDAQ